MAGGEMIVVGGVGAGLRMSPRILRYDLTSDSWEVLTTGALGPAGEGGGGEGGGGEGGREGDRGGERVFVKFLAMAGVVSPEIGVTVTITCDT